MALKLLPPKREKTVSSAEQSQRANRTVLRRTLFLMILCGVVLFIPLIFTLYRLMIVEHDKYEELAINNQTRYTNLTASRGVIYDRNMNVLATSATVETVFIDPNEIATEMKDPANSNLLDHIARGLSEILDVETSFVYEKAADTAYRYKVIRRKISEELADQVREFINENEIKGVYLETDAQRYYPYSSLAAQVLGFVSSDNVGSEGLEAYYDSMLQGTAGKVVTSKGNYGSEMLYTYEKYYDASDGDSFVLTIDATVQAYLEEGKVVVFAAGTGNPFFTTDTAAALRGAEMGAEIVLKATKVDGVYSADPMKDASASRYSHITFDEAIEKHLEVMDAAAFALCRDQKLPIKIFSILKHGALKRVLLGEDEGTLVHL